MKPLDPNDRDERLEFQQRAAELMRLADQKPLLQRRSRYLTAARRCADIAERGYLADLESVRLSFGRDNVEADPSARSGGGVALRRSA